MYQVPALLVQLQDDVSRSRRREAYWISVIVHLFAILVIANSARLEQLLPRRAVMMVNPNDVLHQKDLTYLELPPDAQKITKRPDTNIISDKERNASTRAPQLNREELKKILGGARPGRPGPQVPSQPVQPSPPATQNAPPQTQPQQTSQPPATQDQVAKLQAPPQRTPQPSFNTGSMSAGSAIEQAARAAAANRGGYAGDGGDYGLNRGAKPTQQGELEVLSDTMGVDFGPYLARVLHDVRQNWYNLIPESARAPIMKKGKVSIEFDITKDGTVRGLHYVSESGDTALDRAAYGGIKASDPFPPLPAEFNGPYLALRFHFYYNPDKSDLQ